MKNLYSKLMMGFLLFSTSTINAQTTYCVPSQTPQHWISASAEPITSVVLSQGSTILINQQSTSSVSTSTPKYEDYSSIVANVVRGESYTLKVKGNTDGNNNCYITLYIDWNGDGVFSNSTPTNLAEQQAWTQQKEKHQHIDPLVNTTGEDNIEIEYNLNIPTDAFLGQTRIRVVKNYQAPSNAPCENAFSFGQVEDYTLNITNGSTTPIVCADPGPNVGDIGCVTFTYDSISKTLTTVRAADGTIWLQQNLGSTQVATSMTDTSSYGDIFQWGRWNDGHEKRTSTTAAVPTSNNPSGLTTTSTSFIIGSTIDWWDAGTLTDTWSAISSTNASSTDGCDPCKAIGTGWIMPTQADWTSIQTSENITNPATAYTSNLKLPASGYRSSSNGNYTFVDQRGYYWSSTTSTTGAKYFYIGSVIANPAAGTMRGQGHAVRCIYKTAVNVSTVAVTTQNNVAATITTANGTLQLEAAITPNTANQAVTWSVQSGSTSATVDSAGLVTGLTNGTAVIRATSVADTTKFGELTVTVNIPTANPCTAVQTFLETFETFTTFPENCWTGNYAPTPPAPAITIGGTATNKTVSLYSGFVTGDIIIASPEVSTIDGQHVLGFDIVSFSDATTSIQVGTLSNNTDFTTFAPAGTLISPSVGTHTSIAIPANAGHKYVAIKFIHGGGHKALQLDNIEWKTAASSDKFDTDKVKIYPNPTTGMFFIDTDIDVKSIEIYNTSGQRILTTNQKNINLENAANGLYIVNIYTEDGTHASYKIIKK